eukprot:98237-Prorocentrum_minimum.AAC.1
MRRVPFRALVLGTHWVRVAVPFLALLGASAAGGAGLDQASGRLGAGSSAAWPSAAWPSAAWLAGFAGEGGAWLAASSGGGEVGFSRFSGGPGRAFRFLGELAGSVGASGAAGAAGAAGRATS